MSAPRLLSAPPVRPPAGAEPVAPPAPRARLARLFSADAAVGRRLLQERCRAARRAHSLFLPPRAVFFRVLARTAYGVDGSLARCVDASLRALVEEQADDAASRAPVAAEDVPYYTHVAVRAGLRADDGRRACVVLNRLAPATRRAFRRHVVEGRRALPGSADEARLADARRALGGPAR